MRSYLLLFLSVAAIGLLSFSLSGGIVSNPAAAAPWLAEDATIVLKNGTKISGTIIKETEDSITLKSEYGVVNIKRAKIKEIQRGGNPLREEFAKRLGKAQGDAKALLALAKWAAKNDLHDESLVAYGVVIDLDPNNEKARGALGHGRLDGKWLDAEQVAKYLAKGYVLDGVELVAGGGSPDESGGDDSSGTGSDDPGKSGSSNKGKTRVKPREPTEAETAARNKKLVKRKKALDKFRKQREIERAGVPWERHHIIKSTNYIIHCNSTKKVAARYVWIMEALSHELRKRITKKPHNKRRSDVYIYKSAEEFRAITGSGALGYYSPSKKHIKTFHGTFGATGSTLGVLGHEGTHQIQDKVHPKIWNMTPWLREGMAVYYGDEAKLDYKTKRIIIGKIPRDRLFHIQRKMKAKDHSPLKQLCKIPQMSFGGTYYADAWALVYYLLHSDDKNKGRRFFVEYWERSYTKVLTQRDFTELAKKYFGSVKEMEKRYIAYILSLKSGSAGEVEGEYFTSDQFMLEIMRPTPDYEWSLAGDIRGYLVGMQIPKTQTKVELVFRTNDSQKSPDEVLDEFKAHPEVKRLYGDIEAKNVTLAGCEAYKLTFKDRVRGAGADDDDDDDGDEDEPTKADSPEGDEAEPTGPRKYRWFLICYDKNVYQIRCTAAADEFEEYEYDFDAAARSFDLILRVRW